MADAIDSVSLLLLTGGALALVAVLVGRWRAASAPLRRSLTPILAGALVLLLIGAALGVPLGVFLAGIVTQGLSDQGIGFHLPLAPLVVFTAVAAAAGVLAAILPVRRASRLDVLRALQYE